MGHGLSHTLHGNTVAQTSVNTIYQEVVPWTRVGQCPLKIRYEQNPLRTKFSIVS